MSLINEALKRAKDAQQKTPPSAPGPQFRPPEPMPPQTRGLGLTVPLVIALFAVAGLVFVWVKQHKSGARKSAVETRPATPAVAPVAAAPRANPPVHVAKPTPVAPVVATPAPAVAPEPTVSAPAPELRLQAIFFSPGHSSAIISGKTVRVGNTLKGFRVAAITQASATLVSATQTNVMMLEQ